MLVSCGMRSIPERSGVDKAYGETRYTWGTTPTDYRFTGQRQTESLGLYHMGHGGMTLILAGGSARTRLYLSLAIRNRSTGTPTPRTHLYVLWTRPGISRRTN